MGNPSYYSRPSLGRKMLAAFLAAGIAASVVYSVAGSASMAHDPERKGRAGEDRDVSGFTRIQVKGAIDLELTAGKEFSVHIKSRADRLEDVITEVDGDTLIIDMDDKGRRSFWNNTNVEVTITMPELRELEVLGAVDGELHDIKSDELSIDIRGAAEVEVEGTCGTLTLDVKGAGDIDADDLKCENVEVDVKGAGSATVYASQSIDANVAGVASISVYGNPKNVRKHSGGLSSISIK